MLAGWQAGHDTSLSTRCQPAAQGLFAQLLTRCRQPRCCRRPYTPTSEINQRGHVDFVIKLYPDGQMSQILVRAALSWFRRRPLSEHVLSRGAFVELLSHLLLLGCTRPGRPGTGG